MRFCRWILQAALTPVLAFAADSSCDRPAIAGEFGPQGVAVAHSSRAIRAGDDFFTHVNEHWIATTPIPDGYWDYGQTSILAALVDAQVKQLLDASVAARAPRGSAAQEVGDAYASFLDAAGIERRGLAPV
jgi:putative endopeptidase